MAYAVMSCPKCGMTMKLVNNQFVCEYCDTMAFDIVDAKIEGDVTVMSPEEFGKHIEKNKRKFLVNINNQLKVLDVDTMVINKKLKDALELLRRGDFEGVCDTLRGVPNNILAAERLRLLAEYEVKNEYELSLYDGYIDKSSHYANILKLADEQTKETYQKIAEYCREQYDAKQRMQKEITEVKKLLEVKLFQEAIAYTKEMCKRYPQTALSWAYAWEVKSSISENYNGDAEYSMMLKCPDYKQIKIPETISEKLDNFISISNRYAMYVASTTQLMKKIVLFLWLLIVASGVMLVGGLLYDKIDKALGESSAFIFIVAYLGALISTIMMIVNIVKAFKDWKKEKSYATVYKQQCKRIPKAVQKEVGIVTTKERKLFKFGIVFGIVLVVAMIVGLIIYLQIARFFI